MNQFAQLYKSLDETNSSNQKILLLKDYFQQASSQDALWAIALITHRRPKRIANTTLIKQWAAEFADIPFWLLDESHHIVGDLAETIANIIPHENQSNTFSLSTVIEKLISLTTKSDAEKKAFLFSIWQQTRSWERFVFNKIITGGFRIGVSDKLVVKALSLWLQKDENHIAHRLMGNWSPESTTLENLLLEENIVDNISKPYPFYLAYAVEENFFEENNAEDWLAEYKWDGIRGQIIVRKNELFIWTRGEELVTDKYPELHFLKELLPDGTVLDGELLAFKNENILPFNDLQKRIGRKTVSKKILQEVPVVFFAYDVLEHEAKDIRQLPQQERKSILKNILSKLLPQQNIFYSETLTFASWLELQQLQQNARAVNAEGLMLKNKHSIYETGRKKGNWWKWKVQPYTIDAVMIYAMQGHGRRANLFTDYTFAVWHENKLVPFTKAYSGLTDEEILEVDRFVKKNTIEKFGPVRSVKPELVFEIAFEGIAESSRHKSGIALRFPRISRWRKDKPAQEANNLEDLRRMI